MKKIFTLLLVALMAVGVYANDYKHSIGLYGGLGIGVQYKTLLTDHFTIIAETGVNLNLDDGTGVGIMGLPVADAVFAYQTKSLAQGKGIKFDIYAGGHVKMGYDIRNAGVFGFGAAAGFEANMTNAPIAFSFDFRPGFGMLFDDGSGVGTYPMFDYSFNLGVRYTFPK